MSLEKRFDIESIEFPTVKDIDIHRDGEHWVAIADYEDVAPLFGNISLLVAVRARRGPAAIERGAGPMAAMNRPAWHGRAGCARSWATSPPRSGAVRAALTHRSAARRQQRAPGVPRRRGAEPDRRRAPLRALPATPTRATLSRLRARWSAASRWRESPPRLGSATCWRSGRASSRPAASAASRSSPTRSRRCAARCTSMAGLEVARRRCSGGCSRRRSTALRRRTASSRTPRRGCRSGCRAAACRCRATASRAVEGEPHAQTFRVSCEVAALGGTRRGRGLEPSPRRAGRGAAAAGAGLAAMSAASAAASSRWSAGPTSASRRC